jgi:hypothetical protein
MVLTKEELVATLQNEVRILVHLASKVDPPNVAYRPTPKQRSILELLQYMVIMGPNLVKGIQAGAFDGEAWSGAAAVAKAMNFDDAVAAIAEQSAFYADFFHAFPDSEFRTKMELFGRTDSKGSLIINLVVSGYAAYRTQLFLCLKGCGREELNTMNLWAGMDAPMV